MSEPTGRELELHKYLLAHGAKQVSNVAHALSMQECLSSAIIISGWFWSEKHQQHFCFDTFLSSNLIDGSDIPIETLANFVLRGAAEYEQIGPPQ